MALLVLLQFSGFFFGILTVCLVCYIKAVHNRIPYAASNLKCAITIVKTNLGLGLIALGSMMGLLGYSFSWVWAFAGTMQLDAMTTESISSEDSSDLSAVGGVVALLFVLSFYWTHQVMKNVVRVSVSGVVGTWWFSPAEAASLCSDAVSFTYSFHNLLIWKHLLWFSDRRYFTHVEKHASKRSEQSQFGRPEVHCRVPPSLHRRSRGIFQ